VIEARIRHREPGSAIEWYLGRARELEDHWKAYPVEDRVVRTEQRGVRDIAQEIISALGWE
jgi:hypothetical protein